MQLEDFIRLVYQHGKDQGRCYRFGECPQEYRLIIAYKRSKKEYNYDYIKALDDEGFQEELKLLDVVLDGK